MGARRLSPTPKLPEHSARSSAGIDAHLHRALTDLYAYALILDADWRRLRKRAESAPRSPAGVQIDTDTVRRLQEVGEELEAFRAAIAAFRVRVDPDGAYL